MAVSRDQGHFFQTSSALDEITRREKKSKNTHGNPIDLSAKLSALIRDPHNGSAVYVTTGSGELRNVDIDTGHKGKPYIGSKGPLTSIAISQHNLFGGSWDKNIYSWRLDQRNPHNVLVGHRDFVKALLLVSRSSCTILISGSADGTIMIWDDQTGSRLHVLKTEGRGILSLALDPIASDTTSNGATASSISFFSGSSDRIIQPWTLHAEDGWKSDSANPQTPIIRHETGIEALVFDDDGDLWTASFDKTAKCLNRERDWACDTELVHPDYVRAICIDEEGGYVATACRDEEVRLWDKSSGELVHVFSGHYDEVVALIFLDRPRLIVSASIDGTIRTWSTHPKDIEKAKLEILNANDPDKGDTVGTLNAGATLSLEEEKELEDLMADY